MSALLIPLTMKVSRMVDLMQIVSGLTVDLLIQSEGKAHLFVLSVPTELSCLRVQVPLNKWLTEELLTVWLINFDGKVNCMWLFK